MTRSKSFSVFKGSTKKILYTVRDADGNFIEAGSISTKLYDKNMNQLAELPVVRNSVGNYVVTIDTAALVLEEGKYIIEFKCIANGHNYVRRDYLNVATLM